MEYDIHTRTAALIFNKRAEDVTPAERLRGKWANFVGTYANQRVSDPHVVLGAAESGDAAVVEALGYPKLAAIVRLGYRSPRVLELQKQRDELLAREELTAEDAKQLNAIRDELDSKEIKGE